MRVAGDWLTHPGTRAVCDLLEAAGHRALFVGGCVRDALLGRPVGDIDIATDARPDRVVALAGAAGIKAVPTGIDHGTVTVRTDGEVDLHHGDTVYLTPAQDRLHRFDDKGLAIR